jgi:hypothetical protein
MIKLSNILNEDLRKWFGKGGEGSATGGGWDRYNSNGEKAGKCGDSEKGDAYAACLSKEKAAKLGKDGIAAFVKRKRAAQSDAGDSKKGGEQSKGQKPTFVKTGASEGLEEKINLFLEKNVPTDPAKWAASKAAAKRKFDVYPSAYANGWAAKDYKSKGGDWKVAKEVVIKEEGHENDRDMVVGVAEIVSMIRDMKNREEVLHSMIEKFNKENVIYNRGEFTKMCGL